MSIRLHTPGPWTVDYTDDNLRIRAGDLLIVCYSACKIDPLSRGIGVQN